MVARTAMPGWLANLSDAYTGNRQGNQPARLVNTLTRMVAREIVLRFTDGQQVGKHLCSEKKRQFGTRGARIRDSRLTRCGGSGAFKPLLPFLFMLLLGSFVPAAQAAPRGLSERELEELQVAQQMEAMLIDQMVQEMRKTVPENDYVPKSQAEKIFQQMLDSEYARAVSESNSIGIAELVLAQIRGRR